jgi:hypothetical protein
MPTIMEVVDKLEKDLDDFFAAWDAVMPAEVPEVFCGKYQVRRRQRCEQCNAPLMPRKK